MTENIPCKWDTCLSSFDNQLDMGLHVLTNHLEILNYGNFVLQKSIQKASNGEPAPKKARNISFADSEVSTSSESQSMPMNRASHVSMALMGFESSGRRHEAQDPTLLQHTEMLKMARRLASRFRMLPSNNAFLCSPYYCLPCLQNFKSPCLREHTAAEYRVTRDLKRRLLNCVSPNHLDILDALKSLIADYEEEIARLEESADLAPPTPRIEPFRRMEPHHLQHLRILSSIGPNVATSSFFEGDEEGYGARSKGPREEMLKEPKRERGVFSPKPSSSSSSSSSSKKERLATAPPTTTIPIKKHYNKMSKLCQGLINQLRVRGIVQFRASDRSNFCLTCLNFKKCSKSHDAPWLELEQLWRQEYGHQPHIAPEGLINQLETMKQKFLAEEGAEAASTSSSTSSSEF